MNNFRNPNVDPNSFQGKVYDYYRNSTNPHSIHSSLNNQGGVEQKEAQQSRINNQYDKTKKPPIYINNQLEKITDSKPVMFSPPKVDSIQKLLNEDPIDELAFNIAHSKNSVNEKMDKEEVVSNLIKEFSLMLNDTPSIHEEFKTLQEGELENDSLLNSNESTSIYVHLKHENSEMLFSEIHSMLEERNDHLISDEEDIESLNENNDTIEGTFITMLSESDELREEELDSRTNEEDSESLNKNNDTLEDKFITMLSESDNLEEEKQAIFTNEEDIKLLNENTNMLEDKFITMLSESDELEEEKQDSLFKNAKDTKIGKIEDLSKVEKIHSLQNNDKDYTEISHDDGELVFLNEMDNEKESNRDSKLDSSQQKKYFQQEKEDIDTSNDLKKIDDEWFFKKNTHLIDLVKKKKTTTVKMQVLLARLETDIDIVETINLLMPLDNILKVEWSIHSLDCKVVLPSKTVFLKGEIIAEIEYGNKELENKIQSLKVSIPWSKTANINWLSVPDLPHSNQNEFMFHPQHEHHFSFHYESHQKFAEPIHSQLNQVTFVWYQELNSKDKHLQVNGVAQLSIHFMQEQIVELECYSK